MQIKLHEISVDEVVKGYARDEESGQIVAFSGKLDVRPKYQRNFIYTGEQRDEVIRTILKNFPLNSIYWVKNGEDSYEVLDGQQRTISICDYVKGRFSVDGYFFNNLPDDKQRVVLDYKLFVYICEGTDSEKLEWFRVINIAGETLTEQELRNAVYASEWVSDAKRRFSKRNSLAEQKGGIYLNCKAIRQEILEKAIAWFMNSNADKKICEYMAKCAKDCTEADELWLYFCRVIDWVEAKFPKYRKEMKGLEWGLFYNAYKDKPLNANELEARIKELFMDDEVTSKKGIYEYLLSGAEKCLNLRAFTESQKGQVYERQNGLCANGGGVHGGGKGLKNVKCPHENEKLELTQMQADHIIPWSKGGKTELSNCQMLCKECNSQKSDKF